MKRMMLTAKMQDTMTCLHEVWMTRQRKKGNMSGPGMIRGTESPNGAEFV